ncbi:kelch repeat-containing protein [Flavobacterium sp.]|uniref:DUF7619 domain-containing protein n=1 Tax=Flavobacterium sp. TaxID=239 RepID=UPI00261255A2|nr:kelch repeat-containing protein [Flavobacterium sp.]
MLKKYLVTLTLFVFYGTMAQLQNQWTWVQGKQGINAFEPEYGMTGIEDASNWPGGREKYTSVTTSDGRIWIFGGQNNLTGRSCDLWVFNPLTNNFTYKKGRIAFESKGFSAGVNVDDYRNFPAARSGAQMWVDSADNIWLLGFSSDFLKNDLWKYSTSTGDWIQVASYPTTGGNYGSIGVASTENYPPLGSNAATWTDNQGNLWMYGGLIASSNNGYLSALWKYNIQSNTWTWMKGASNVNQNEVYVSYGIESENAAPGGRTSALSWTDAQGNLWLFGGYGVSSSVEKPHNDIWKFNPATNNWTWMSGHFAVGDSISTLGTEDLSNQPQGISEQLAGWKDANNYFWVYGANGNLWRYNPSTNLWALMKSNDGIQNAAPVYGEQGVAALANTPGSRRFCRGWNTAGGDFYLYSGSRGYNIFPDLWKYNAASNSWTWVKGCGGTSEGCPVVVKSENSTSPNITPGGSVSDSPHWNDHDGNLWLFGGGVIGYYYGNDSGIETEGHIWKFTSETKQWSLVYANFNDSNVYPAQGIENETNSPSHRTKSATWTDLAGNLWLYGGNDGLQFKSDLWKFNTQTKMWSWVSGFSGITEAPIHGIQGVPAPENTPGGRWGSVTWTDTYGNLWLFGGDSQAGYRNDLWKYDMATGQWTWMKGSQLPNGASVFNGLTAPENTPSADSFQMSNPWTSGDNILWLQIQYSVWKYDIAQNLWIRDKASSALWYGTFGVGADINSPRRRKYPATWTDADGNLLLYSGMAEIAGSESPADFWKYSIPAKQWIWTGGVKDMDVLPSYSSLGEVNYKNFPGNRTGAISWQDNGGNRYLFGGYRDDENSNTFSDVWMQNAAFNTITGTIKFDSNADGCTDTDVIARNVRVTLQSGDTSQTCFTDKFGKYTFYTNNTPVTVSADMPFFSASPASQQFAFESFQNTEVLDFCLSTAAPANDVRITVVPTTPAIPGFDAKYKLIYTNYGTSNVSGSIHLDMAQSTTAFVSSTPVLPTPEIFDWNFNNLSPFETREIVFTLHLNAPTDDPALNGGDQLHLTGQVNIAVTDQNPDDNTFNLVQEVVNSFDPNDKICLQGKTVDVSTVGDFVNYTIHFENTGSASASNIIVTDTIDPDQFDIASLVPVGASHNYRTVILGNKVTFFFDQINLPSSGNTRFGYVSFRIKTNPSLVIGDVFSNLADIYFDYNYPIVTDSANTLITETLGTDPATNPSVTCYPNPVNDVLFINGSSPEGRAGVYDTAGRIVKNCNISNNRIDLSGLSKGIYFVKISGSVLKIMKK